MGYEPEQLDFLRQHYTGVITTVGEYGELWGSAVYYALNTRDEICFFTKNKTRKYKNLSADPRLSFVVYDPKYRMTLQLNGRAEAMKEQKEINFFFDKINRVLAEESHPLPIEKLKDVGDYVVMKIIPLTIRFTDYSQPSVEHF